MLPFHNPAALPHFACIESPVSFPGIPLTVVEEKEMVEFRVYHIQTINHIFKLNFIWEANPISVVVPTNVQVLDKR